MREGAIEELLRRYEVQERSARIVHLLNSTRGAKIAPTLRGHWEDPIVSQSEIEVRDDLNELLAGCSVLEILSFLSSEPPDLPPDLAQALQTTLVHPDVRHYYEYNYPIVLPQLFRDRLPAAYRTRRHPSSARRVPIC